MSATTRAQDRPLVVHTDKVLHAAVSATIVDAVWVSAAALEQPIEVRLALAVGVGALAGISKETADLAGFGTPEVLDLVFDGFGIAVGVAVALVAEVVARDLARDAESAGD
jgi:hypothetical protein